MQEAIDHLVQAAAALLVVAAERLAQNPDKAAELISIRKTLAAMADHLRAFDNAAG